MNLSNQNFIDNILELCRRRLLASTLSLVSRKLYLGDIRKFLSYLGQLVSSLSISDLTNSGHYISYLDSLQAAHLDQSLIKRNLASLKQLGLIISTSYHVKSPTEHLSLSQAVAQETSSRFGNYIKPFIKYLESEHLSPITIKSYKSDLTRYLDWVATSTTSNSIKEVLTKKLTDKYLNHLSKVDNITPSTLERKDQSLLRFRDWLTHPTHTTISSDNKINPILRENFDSRSHINKPGRSFSFIYTLLPSLVVLVLSLGLAYFGYRQLAHDRVILAEAYPNTPITPNRQLSFQGRLESSSGTPITSATNLVFKLWNDPSAGSQLYTTGTCSITPDSDGVFSTQIGSTCGSAIASSVFTENANVYLEITVGSETLSPRQQIATVAYALNSETLQGFPISATVSAVRNTVVPMNQWGEIIIGEQSPRMTGVSGTFAISAPALSITTTTGTSGNITLAPDGTGQVNLNGNTTTTNFFNVANAQLTTGSLITGTAANNNTGFKLLDLFSGSSPTSKFSVTDTGLTTVGADLYLSSGLSTFGTAVSDGTVEATKFCTGDGETNCTTDFAALATPKWNSLTDPDGNLSLTMGTNTSTFSTTVGGTTSILPWIYNLTNNTSSGTQNLITLNNVNGGTGVTESLLYLDNSDDNTLLKGIQILGSSTGAITTAIDVSDAEIATALDVGANDIVGTTGNIDLTNFDVVGSTGTITTAGNINLNGNTLFYAAGTESLVWNPGDGEFELSESIQISDSDAKVRLTDITSGGDDFNIEVDADVFSINDETDGATRMTIGDTGLVTVTGAFAVNGQADIGDGGDAINLNGNSLSLATTGVGSDITINAVDQIILTDFTTCTALETIAGVLTCGTDDGGTTLKWNALTSPDGNLALTMAAYTSTFGSTATGTGDLSPWSYNLTNSSSAGNQNLLTLSNVNGSTGTTESLLYIDNADDTAVTAGIQILGSSTGAITNAIDASDAEIVTALSVGDNDIAGTTGNIDLTNFDVVGSSGNVTATGIGTFGAPAASTAQLVVKGGASGADIIQLVRTTGATLTYGWSLAGNKMSFNNVTDGFTTLQTSRSVTMASTSEVNVGADYGAGDTHTGDQGLLKGSDSGGAGTDSAGGDLYIASGRGTGASNGTSLFFQTPNTTSTGTTRQTLATRMTIDGSGNVAVGAGTFSTAGILDANGQVDLGDGGDAITVNGSSLSLLTTGAGSDITINAVDQVILTDFVSCTALETDGSGNLLCGSDATGGGGAWSDLTNPTTNLTLAHGVNTTTMGWTSTGALDAWTTNFNNNSTAGSNQNALVINNAPVGVFTDAATESLILLQQLDTTTAGTTVLTNALKIDSAASSGITNGISITNSAGNITTGINIADTAGGTLTTGITLSGTMGTGIDAGNTVITNIGNASTDFNGNGGLTLAENLTIQGTTGLTFSTGVGGDITFANLEKIDNDTNGTIAITAPTTSLSGNLTVQGTTGLTFSTGVGGDITFANLEKIDNDTNGTINISAGTLLLTGGTAVSSDQLSVNLFDSTTTTLTVGSALTTLNLADSTTTKAIDIGGITNSGTDTVSISTNATAADTIAIGNNNIGTLLTLTGGDDWSISNTGILTMSASAAQTTAIVATDTDYTNALSVGDNSIIGTTGLIDYTNFDVDALGNISSNADGSDTTTPRSISFVNMSVGEAARFNFDGSNGMQNANGDAVQLYAYHTIELRGDRSIASAPGFSSESDIGVHLFNTTDTSKALVVTGSTTQSANLTEWQNSSTTPLAYIDSTGNLTVANQNDLRMMETTGGGTDYVGLQAADTMAATTVYKLPNAFPAGASGYYLTSNTSGDMSWTNSITASALKWNALTDPDGSLTLAHGVNATTFGWTNTGALDGFTMNLVNNGAASTTQDLLVVNNAVAGSFTDTTTENLILVQQLDTTTAGTTLVSNGIKIDSAGSSAMSNGLTITNSAGNITTGINIADTAGGTLTTGIAISGTLVNAMDAGAFPIVNIGSVSTDFNSNGGLQLAENLIIQGTTGLTFNTGVGGDITFANLEKIDNDTDGSITITAPTLNLSATTLTASSLATMDTAASTTWDATTVTLGGSATINGGSGVSGTLTLVSTSNATKGNIQFFSSSNTIDSSGNLILAGTLRVNGNSIITSAGTEAISMSNDDISVVGCLNVGSATECTNQGYAKAAIFEDTISSSYYLDPGSALSLQISGDIRSNGALIIDTKDTSGVATGGSITLDAGAGDVNIGAAGAGKLNVTTIDPPYTINGGKFATYVASMTGVKEETTGNINTSEYVAGYGYRAKIDFANASQGSDTWLFRETTDLYNNFSNLVVLLSPNGNTKAWYEADPSSRTLYIYSSTPSSISYRLTAPRIDHNTWANNRDNDAVGIVINSDGSVWDKGSNPMPTYTPTNDILTPLASGGEIKVNSPITLAPTENASNVAEPILQVEGEIEATTISARVAELTEIKANKIVADEIVAGKIQAGSIEGLEATIASLSAGSTKGLSDEEVSSLTDRIKARIEAMTAGASAADLPTPPESTSSALVDLPADFNSSIASDSAILSSLTVDILAVTGSLSTDSIQSISDKLALQPLGGTIALAGNTLIVDSTGLVTVNGNLEVTGRLTADTASLNSLVLGESNEATSSALGQLMSIYNEQGIQVASIDASGSANLASVTTQLITIASGKDSTASGEITGSSTSNSTAGSSVLSAGKTEITIASSYVTTDSLVYLTPTTNTDNKVLFVKSKDVGKFTVGIDASAGSDISFNWWIIELKQ